ncbi:methionyl-tRNA formyltransferase [candidate division WOR-1 bacterium RIFOXYB2_FULL_48_7]|uniref:Methionyl-tRNA formyltransferase n=2 Tax=Saganbacteria TaxID=1703751 RepID=A0A1F4U3W8_UNCSA|nr:MAG: methionyl-tRNA formyltransferase [candidate division WOR-1 bacterium RIFOXYB2_FULL_48_7]OGC39612.1 MAG: methionyl-tRNA formyltransferase [candidate division WOR-1 bacterium RIFOXYC2_FULL_46_14]
MRLAFFGTPEIAATVLRCLHRLGHDLVLVVSQPDKPKGRGQQLMATPVKQAALELGLLCQQPETIKNNREFQQSFSELNLDLVVVAAYGKIIPPDLLSLPQHGFINLHASLLPKYRGAAPVQWALLNGEKATGMTIFKIIEQLDAGPIIDQAAVEIGDDEDAGQLLARLFQLGCGRLENCLAAINNNSAKYIVQDESLATLAPTLKKEMGKINWQKSAREIHNQIRGLVLWPTAYAEWQEKRLKILKARPFASPLLTKNGRAGLVEEVVRGEGFIVQCGQGKIEILEVQPESGRPMSGYNFAIGHKLIPGETLLK